MPKPMPAARMARNPAHRSRLALGAIASLLACALLIIVDQVLVVQVSMVAREAKLAISVSAQTRGVTGRNTLDLSGLCQRDLPWILRESPGAFCHSAPA